jgi:hypothetical protein
MPKKRKRPFRPLPEIPGAYMVPEPRLSPEERAEILETLPLADTTQSDAAIAEVEEILGDLQAELKRQPEVREAAKQLEDLANATAQTDLAIGALGVQARVLALMEAPASATDLDQLSRSAFWLSNWARRTAEDICPGVGRAEAWPERMAIAQLAGLWERRTGQKVAWLNRDDDGGPFCRFAQAVSKELSHRQIQWVLERRNRN